MQDFEKLGVFYLGREFDPVRRVPKEDLVLYDSKDMVTHAVCVGMTGSGKTGLCLAILEEAAIDNIPALIVDPKGDLANLLLTFPHLKGEDFEPWVNTEDARKRGLSVKEFAKEQAGVWKKGLAEWGQDGARIQMLRDSADFVIYTPGSNAGIPISILQSFDAPPEALRNDTELLRERVSTTTTSLLGLLNIDADPIQSREHILVSNLLHAAWKAGNNMDLASLIQQIQTPPLKRLGVLDLETFFPAKDRFALAMQFNNLLASPSFAAWMEGIPLDIGSILHTKEGKPRMAIFSIAHLADSERMFFVALLMNQILGWMRQQPGTTSLRALVYMDEIFGYFPPVKNPPSKTPMLTLLKQGRAFGLGMVLATQNPVDIDYKGLSNCGTWFVGRLQTERDKARLLEGLEGAASSLGQHFDRQAMERIISGLGSRVFLMHNTHEDHPVVFQTRWDLCYLRGPLNRPHIKALMDPRREEFMGGDAPPAEPSEAGLAAPDAGEHTESQVILPPEVPQFFIPLRSKKPAEAQLIYKPRLLGLGQIYFSDTKSGIDTTLPVGLLAEITEEAVVVDWEHALEVDLGDDELEKRPAQTGCLYAHLPREAAKPRSYDGWKRSFADHLYRNHKLQMFKSASLKMNSKTGESEGEFRVRLQQIAREQRDQAAEKLRQKYAPKINALNERIRKAQQAVEKEKEQSRSSKLAAVLNFGATVLGAFLGRKTITAATVSKANTTVRSANRTMKESQDVAMAEENVGALAQMKAALEAQFQQDLLGLESAIDPAREEFETVLLKPKKTNIQPRVVALVWEPWWRVENGIMASAWR